MSRYRSRPIRMGSSASKITMITIDQSNEIEYKSKEKNSMMFGNHNKPQRWYHDEEICANESSNHNSIAVTTRMSSVTK